jgi:hypothetical protein
MMNERALALMSATALRLAEGMNALQRLAESDGCEMVLSRQAQAVVEEYDLLRYHLRESTLRAAIAPRPEEPEPTAEPRQAARKTALAALHSSLASKSPQAKGGRARAAALPPAERQAIARKAAKARWGK